MSKIIVIYMNTIKEKTKNNLNGLPRIVFIVGLFVLAFTRLNAIDTLRLIAQITILLLLLSGIVAIIFWILIKLKKKESKVITEEEIIKNIFKKSAA